MLLAPTTTTQRAIPPGFIDFASSSFDAILHRYPLPSPTEGPVRRSSHLPDLLPFIQLIVEKCHIQPIHMILALMYVHRFRDTLPSGYRAEPEAAHRIFAASLLVASKYIDDHCLTTKQLVRATGDVWSIKEMTRMELAFLTFLKWNLHVRQEEMIAFFKTFHFDITSILSPMNDT